MNIEVYNSNNHLTDPMRVVLALVSSRFPGDVADTFEPVFGLSAHPFLCSHPMSTDNQSGVFTLPHYLQQVCSL